eukprot:GHVP01036688.1.p1 GENE.GHVP01036688.1~~GHVP01036688.1.p1  ORF type:complete len:923 (+),score=120.84 GHVP01036688.1:309-3077(+)
MIFCSNVYIFDNLRDPSNSQMEAIFQEHGDDVHFELKRKNSYSALTQSSRPVGWVNDPSKKEDLEKCDLMWNLMATYIGVDTSSIQRGIVNHIEYTLAKTRFNFDQGCLYRATAFSIRDRLIESLNDTNQSFHEADPKRCYYLSLEFLMGRAMQNALVNLDLEPHYTDALVQMCSNLEDLYDHERDAALGNGGLGRLAACFLDSMATLDYPCWGYGIRYTYGIFEQKLINGRQYEYPDYWLVQDNPWEICRQDVTYAVRFYGEVKEYIDKDGERRARWVGGEIVQAIAYDNPVPGYDTFNCINLRLWKAVPSKEFDLSSFNEGQYLAAVGERQNAEAISAVLYPNDNTEKGKELRLRQQYFFVCATIQDILRRYRKKHGHNWENLGEKVAVQLNDTHPTIGIPELLRILIDVEKVSWAEAWRITRKVFHYTNHTVLPEALEKWSADLLKKLLPRHLQIINLINHHFLQEVHQTWGQDFQRISKMSIYEEGMEKKIRMANLAIIGSDKVNGVAAIHTEIVKKDIFPHFREHYEKVQPNVPKFLNMTNGVTPRRWIHCANRPLSELLTELVGSDEWIKDLSALRLITEEQSKDPYVQQKMKQVKFQAKNRLAKWVKENTGIEINPVTMLFDVQVKRIHEYKRQLMNCMYIIYRYLLIKKLPHEERRKIQPRAVLIGGKAAPGYFTAKTIIKLVNQIAAVVNQDTEVNDYLKVVFLPNYNVSSAQVIIPASDISQHISTAGTEASGTSNMKFVMNGGLIIGTLDGANVEILEECGEDTMFVFGAKEYEIADFKHLAQHGHYPVDNRLMEVFNWIRGGHLRLGDDKAHSEFCGLVENLLGNGHGRLGDNYLLIHDFPSYIDANERLDALYQDDNSVWVEKTLKAISKMGKFSSDRTIKSYADEIWNLKPCPRDRPDTSHISTGFNG